MTFIIEQLEIDKCESLEQAWDFGADTGEELYKRSKERGMHPGIVLVVFEALGGVLAEGLDGEEIMEKSLSENKLDIDGRGGVEDHVMQESSSNFSLDIEGMQVRKGLGAKVSSMVELFEGKVSKQELSMSMFNLGIDENDDEADEEGITEATQILLAFIKGIVDQIEGIFEEVRD